MARHITAGDAVDARVLAALKAAGTPMTSNEIISACETRGPLVYPSLTRLRTNGKVRRRPPTDEEIANRRAVDERSQMRYLYELGSGSENDVDPRSKKPSIERLIDRRAKLRAELDEVEALIEQERERLQTLLDLLSSE